MVLLLVRSSGGSDLHWLVVRFRGGLEEPTAGYSRSRDSALLLLGRNREQWVQRAWQPHLQLSSSAQIPSYIGLRPFTSIP